MNRDDIIKLAREANGDDAWDGGVEWVWAEVERFAALVAAVEREKVAKWMIQRSYATGHGDTIEDLLAELDWQIAENWNQAMIKGIETEREACAKVCDYMSQTHLQKESPIASVWASRECAEAIRARGQG